MPKEIQVIVITGIVTLIVELLTFWKERGEIKDERD